MGSGVSKSQQTRPVIGYSEDGNTSEAQVSYYTKREEYNSTGTPATSKLNENGPTISAVVMSAKNMAALKKKEKEEARENILLEHPELADAMDSVRDYMQEISNKRDDDVTRKNMNYNTRQTLDQIYSLYFDCEEQEHKRILGDQLSQYNAGQICTDYLKVLSEDGINTPTKGYDADCLYTVRSVCWNYSDASLEFAAELGRTGSFSIFISDIVTFKSQLDDDFIRRTIIEPSVAILHNCAKAPGSKKYFTSANALDAIIPYTNVTYQELKMVAMMTLSYIIEEKDNDKISADGSMIEFILMYLKESINGIDHKYEGFSAHEIVSGIMHLASNDDNKLKIVKQGVLPLLVELLQDGNDAEKKICAKTVWVLSFKDENKPLIQEQENMMELLKELAGKSGKAKDAAAGALWVLANVERLEKKRSKNENKG
uniref:uncharacterized protein LOC120344817 n=1 Tax=Styela clava TaxID=7725 RepID=UPI00193A494C|nr:uncharacterized protein LOC120344817 [Styela clava]